MTLISTKQGKLFKDGELIKSASFQLFQPSGKFETGDLSIEASPKNIYSVSESLLELFIRPKGMILKDWKWGYPTLDVVGKFKDGTYPPKRSDTNLTRGWCYLIAGSLHRFFYRKYDLYKVDCPLTPTGINPKTKEPYKKDYHWWLESKCRKYVIDLTEEQYLNVGIENVRDGGVKRSPLGGASYGLKTRNMAFIVATHRYPDAVDFPSIQTTGYVKKYSEISDALTANELLDAVDENKNARIIKIKFHTSHHLTPTGTGGVNRLHHLEKELHEYWKNRYIEFDANESLDKPLRLIEKESDKLFKKVDYFVIESLLIRTNQTSKNKIDADFQKTIDAQDSAEEKIVFNQHIRIRNPEIFRMSNDDKRTASLVMEIDELSDEFMAITEKINNTLKSFDQVQLERFHKNMHTPCHQIRTRWNKTNQQIYGHLNFSTTDSPPPWEGKGYIDPDTGESVGDVEAWEKDGIDPSKLLKKHYAKRDGLDNEEDSSKPFERLNDEESDEDFAKRIFSNL